MTNHLSGNDASRSLQVGLDMHQWASDLFPICRSITGPGVRDTLDYLGNLLPGLKRHSIPSGTPVCDWEVPPEWTIDEAYIETAAGQRLIDFARNNLHVVGYSVPVDQWLTRAELAKHVFTLPDQPDWIPYVTSYYAQRWGFCLSANQWDDIPDESLHVVIKSSLRPGQMDYADLVIPGANSQEILFSTYVCHPSMANNELSGPVVAAALARYVNALPDRRYTYRFVFLPETIGAITYLSRHADAMKANTIAGYVLTCVGDERTYSYLPSRRGNSYADHVALQVLAEHFPAFKHYDFNQRGSDERQYCWPTIDLPVASITRSKYHEYDEYHTSADDLTLVTPAGLAGSYDVYCKIINKIESDRIYRATTVGEPQLGKRGLYSTLSHKNSSLDAELLLNILVQCDGETNLDQIIKLVKTEREAVERAIDLLLANGLIASVYDMAAPQT